MILLCISEKIEYKTYLCGNLRSSDRVGEDTFEMYLRYRYMKGCIFWYMIHF